MGMFFVVRKEEGDKCPFCGEPIGEWQSKDSFDEHDQWGGCCERHPDPLPTLEKAEVANFYESCGKCGKWIEYRNEKGVFKLEENLPD